MHRLASPHRLSAGLLLNTESTDIIPADAGMIVFGAHKTSGM